MTTATTATIRFDADKAVWIGEANGKKVVSSYDKTRVEKMMSKAGFANVAVEVSANDAAETNAQAQWAINERFGFLTQLVTMVAKRKAVSVIVTGQGGLGKTHTVRAALETAGLKDADDFDNMNGAEGSYKIIKGYSTPKGLYRELFNNKDSVIVFDDCDSVLKDAVALNLLKGALDSYDKRVISWNAEMRDEELPTSFQFNGRVIFISNMKKENMDNALMTRAYSVDLMMTTAQKIERMQTLVNDETFMPTFELQYKQDALRLIELNADNAKEVSLRTLQAVTRVRANGGNWQALAKYILTA
jgi:hypothetical protein